MSYVAPADYQPQSQLDVIVKGALGRIALRGREFPGLGDITFDAACFTRFSTQTQQPLIANVGRQSLRRPTCAIAVCDPV